MEGAKPLLTLFALHFPYCCSAKDLGQSVIANDDPVLYILLNSRIYQRGRPPITNQDYDDDGDADDYGGDDV